MNALPVVSEVHILNGTPLAAETLKRIEIKVGETFGVKARTIPSPITVDRAFDRSRRQHNSTALLTLLVGMGQSSNEKNILIVDVDLYIPVLTFVFGEAQLNGVAAVVSTHRLLNQYYGLSHDDELMLRRLEKETIHELGHTFGLYHCRQFECVMRSSTYVEEIDLKKAELCTSCRETLKACR